MGSSTFSGKFRVPSCSEEHHDRRNLHPDEQTNDRRQAAIYQAVRNPPYIEAEARINHPPEKGGSGGAGENISQAFFFCPRDPIDYRQGKHGERHRDGRKKNQPQKMDWHLLTELFAEPSAQLPAEDAKNAGDENWGDRNEQKEKTSQLAVNETNALLVFIDEMDAFHEQFHHLGPAQKGAGPTENGVFHYIGTSACKEISDNALAAGWQKADEILDRIQCSGFRAEPARGKANGKQQGWEKSQEYVESNRLGNHSAARKDPTEGSDHSAQ